MGYETSACESSEKLDLRITSEIIAHNNTTVLPNTDSKNAIKKAIMVHLDASATRDVAKMKTVLHDDFRIVVNQAEKLMVLDLKTMISLYEQGKFGGEKKDIEIKTIDEQGGLTAMAKVIEKGEKAIFNIYFTLINVQGEWKIIHETAYLDYMN